MEIPKVIKDLLENEELCAMATCSENQPYISLMNFTFVEEENIVILSSRRDSKKYSNIQNNKNVSLLFSSPQKISATFLGTAVAIENDVEEKHYKELHMKINNMPQFILGDNVGIIAFNIDKIIVSDNEDQISVVKANKEV